MRPLISSFYFSNYSKNVHFLLVIQIRVTVCPHRSGCDLNSPRKVGRDGRGGDEAHDLVSFKGKIMPVTFTFSLVMKQSLATDFKTRALRSVRIVSL